MVSITTLNPELARRMEPRAAAPARRLRVVETLSANDIPVGVLLAPMIPYLNDSELSDILVASGAAGALDADYVLLRLPQEVAGLFEAWLQTHYPNQCQRIMHRIQDCRGGRVYDARFGKRMRGEGVFADLISRRFHLAVKKLAFPGLPVLRCDRSQSSQKTSPQMDLFEGL